ncbi:hypothetical protein FRB91_008033 [Serendipita sp. 411]|nr:hypothetical protein FRC16_002322 [Serendipita sp. 398]KAG8859431.1 hypothetical protein FRB91_008033 [Serendipita sp. 411]
MSSNEVTTTYIEPTLSPATIHRLPLELLETIFLLLQEDYTTLRSIGSTCRIWRAIHVTTPQFWTDLRVHLQPPLATHSMARERIDTIIVRTGSLKVFMSIDQQIDETDSPNALQLIARLVTGIPIERWKYLRLRSQEYTPHIESYIKGTIFSNLEVLEVAYYDRFTSWILHNLKIGQRQLRTLILSGRDNLGPGLLNIEEGIAARPDLVGPGTMVHYFHTFPRILNPQLQHVSATIRHRPFMIFLTGRAQPSVTELDLEITYFDGAAPALARRFPNLEKLILHIKTLPERHSTDDLLFPHLRYLMFKGPSYSYLREFIAPQLETLSLQGTGANSPEELEKALDDPRFQLSPLFLEVNDQFDFLTVMQIMSLSPRLTRLSLFISPSGPMADWLPLVALLRRKVTMRGEIRWELCPHLESLEVTLEWDRCISEVEEAQLRVKTIVDDRKNGALRSVIVRWNNGSVFEVENRDSV